jgi:hypothetical protein
MAKTTRRRLSPRFVGAVLIGLLMWFFFYLFCLNCCAEENDLTFDLMKKSYFTLYILDTGFTLGLMQNPCIIECNPIWKPIIHNEGLVMALDFGILIGANYLFNRIHRWNKPVSYIFLGLAIFAQAYCVRENWRCLNGN